MTSFPAMANPAKTDPTMTDPASRLGLLHTARAVQHAATAGDVDSLHDEVCRLRNALVERMRDAGRATDGATDAVQHRLARHGQQRLLRFLDELLATTHERPGACTCLVRGAELRSMLVRQLRLEASVTHRFPGSEEKATQMEE